MRVKRAKNTQIPYNPHRKGANKKRGHETYENDRPTVVGIVGRQTGNIRIEVKEDTKKASLNEQSGDFTLPASTANTDEWQGYNDIPKLNLRFKKMKSKGGV